MLICMRTLQKMSPLYYFSIKRDNSKDKISYLPEVQSKHGSSALYDSTEGYEGYWEALVSFFKNQK